MGLPVSSQLQFTTVTIAASGTVSSAGCLEGGWLIEVQTPDMVGTAISFQTSHDGVTYQQVYQDGVALSVTVADNKNVNVATKKIVANYVKVVSGTTETAEAVFTLVYMMINK